MADVFNGKADARQTIEGSGDRFAKRYRQLSSQELTQHDRIKDSAALLGELLDLTPPSRERALAITKLEECVMWAIKGLSMHSVTNRD